jgi:hypothetical protein
VPLAGDVLDESVGLEDPVVGEAIKDGVAIASARYETGTTEHSEVLAHVGYLTADPRAEVADRELTDGERLEDAQALGVREGSTDGRIALAIDLRGDRQVVQHMPTVSVFAQTRKFIAARRSDRGAAV